MLGMLVIGGLGTTWGRSGRHGRRAAADLARVTSQFLNELFPAMQSRLLNSFRPIFFGLVLMLFLIFESRGLTAGR
jgi:branched-chain amino acid transport system permease protein